MSLGIKRSGKYEVAVMQRLSSDGEWAEINYLNTDDVSPTEAGDLLIQRRKVGGGEFDGRVQHMILYAAGHWSRAVVKLQEEEGVTES